MPTLTLLDANGTAVDYTMRGTPPGSPGGPPVTAVSKAPATSAGQRVAYAAAHVVAQPNADIDPWLQCAVDWEATIAFRHHLWSLGLGVAEAMDTAQRGMGLDWPTSLELIGKTLAAARDVPGARVASGCGTDQLDPAQARSVDDVIRAYEAQMAAIEALGGRLILMCSRALARVATGPDDYERVYDRLLRQAREPVILHWLGPMFDPALAGYWGRPDVEAAMDTALGVIAAHADKVDGIKISLLDKRHEVLMRRRLPPGVRMFTGDDFHYPELIEGDGIGTHPNQRHSDALLGIFDAIAPVAASALSALSHGDIARYRALFGPTVPLARQIFKAPTRFYKTGVVFMAWLNGHQDHFTMVGGQHSARSLPHLCDVFRLADAASALADPDLAAHRMAALMAVHGVDRRARSAG